jgi:hypothetical protein
MKKVYLLLLFVFGFSAFAQQKGISYQAVIINPNSVAAPGYNGTSTPLANKAICLSFKIVNSANQVEYQESQSITTDGYGMVNVVIGTGTSGTGLVSTLEAVAWNQGNKKLVVGVNTDGVCSNYTEISNQVLNYTPYSFYAQNADIKDGYVTTAKLADGAVTDPKVAMGINPAKVGLGNVNNTSDANKPVSIATQTALNLKANATDVTTSLSLKEDISNKSNASLGTSTTLYPTQNAVKTYVDSQISSATIVDADATTKGKIKLAGDLAGTADLPTVPGLTLKANTTDVITALNLKSDAATVSTELDLKLDASQKGVPNGLATLNSSGIIPSSQLPPVTLSSTSVVGSDAEMTALSSATVGSIAIRTDANKNYVLSALPASTLVNWVELLTPAAPVQAVNGYTGSVNLAKYDVGLGDVDNTSDASKPVSNLTQAALNLKLDANKVGVASGVASLNALGKVPTDQIPAISFSSVKVLSTQADMLALSNAVVGSVVIRTDVNKNYVLAAANPSILANWIELLTPAPPVQTVNGMSGNISLTKSDIGLGNVENTTDANKPISSATQTALNLKANSADLIAAIAVKAPLASPTFTGTVTTGAISATNVTSLTYASTPKLLSYTGSTINWNPSQGLNAAITLTQNSALSFTVPPPIGSYGTIVLTQDATGTRTITLPTIAGVTNQILGSTSTTSITLSTAANSKDILNFYYDGTNCYWNIGQGYGTAATAASSTSNLATGVTGTLAVANGGTGTTTLTGLIKGNGTGAMTVATAGSDYQEPITLTTTGTGAATLTGNTLNIPAVSSTVNANTITGTISIANGGTGTTTKTTAFDALSPMTASGDIIYGGTSGTGTRLAKGTDGQVLQLANGIPAWQDGFNKNTERVAFGAQAGMTNQGIFTTAVGPYSGILNQGDNATALGRNAGNSNQGGGAVAIGLAAAEFSQGANAIAIGSRAGNTSQHANSIVLNATGSTLNTATANSLYVAPIRDETAIGNILVYNTTSKEITVAPNFAGGRVTAKGGSTYNDFVGFSFNGGDWAKNTGMFSDNPDSGGSAILKFRIATSNSTANSYLEINPSKVSVLPTTTSTSKTTGALTVAGGLGVTGDVYATNLNASGTLSVSSFTVGQGKTPASGDNLAIGRSALNNTTSNGWPNIGLGSFSLNQTTDGKNNIGLGLNALYSNTTGSANIGIGSEAARNAATSSNITAVGMEALRYESGAGNTALGSFAGKPSTNAVYIGTTNSTFLGYNTTTSKTAEQTITNSTAIGYGAAVTASHTIQLGNASVTDVKTSGALTTGAVTYPISHGSANQVLSTTGSGTLTWTTPASSGGTHTIGESYGGGIVFHTWDDGAHGLIAYTSDIATAAQFMTANAYHTIGTADGILAGKNNTSQLVFLNQMWGNSSLITAPIACYNFKDPTYNFGDWYLPSKYELNLLNQQRNLPGLSGTFSSTEAYWSSNVLITNNVAAWLCVMNGNPPYSTATYGQYRVRPIRSF